jgi:hypothetical protein
MMAGQFVSDNTASCLLALKVLGFVVRIGLELDEVATGCAFRTPS